MGPLERWLPATLLGVGSGLVLLMGPDRIAPRPLNAPLTGIPTSFAEYSSPEDLPISEDEQRVAGMDDYLYRIYRADSTRYFTVYVGYYEKQYSGKAIHSPRNCLPGAGWEPLASTTETIEAAGTSHPVNRYLLQNGEHRALVLYWYQGRGRVAASEYQVKWDLLRDSAIRRRSDEALVRVLVPLLPDLPERTADSLAASVASHLIVDVANALPTG
ncbi:MAG: EpsI family protein [Gemmatimonadales bacterium]